MWDMILFYLVTVLFYLLDSCTIILEDIINIHLVSLKIMRYSSLSISIFLDSRLLALYPGGTV